MKACNNNHVDIDYKGNTCPLCEALGKILVLQFQLDEMKDNVKIAEKNRKELLRRLEFQGA